MSDWKDTRLVVTYKQGSDPETEISPIDSFTPTFALNAEVIHSIERTHAGVVYSSSAPTSSAPTSSAPNSGPPSSSTLTSATPTSATPMGAPTATFSGFSLGAGAETNDHTKVAIGAGT